MKKFTLTLFVTLLLGIQAISAQEIRVTGTVSDANGSPLAGVTVVVEGTQRGTTTLGNGTYSIIAPGSGTLHFSFIGMTTVIVPVENRNTIDIVLETDALMLDEVVVSFGTMRKRDLTGSVTSIGADQLQMQTVSSASRALSGQVSGVQVYSNSGQPGSDANIYVRGIGSINASQAALIVVDGVPYPSGLSAINPNDIESIVVSKDATSNALYGSQAANGVVHVTTKSGKGSRKGGTITFDMRLGQNSQAIPDAEKLNSRDYVEYMWAARYNQAVYGANQMNDADARAWAQQYIMEDLGYFQQFKIPTGSTLVNPNTGKISDGVEQLWNDDWRKLLTSPAFRQEYNLSVSGANEKTDYYVSLGYLDDPSFVIRSYMKRWSGRAQVNAQVKDWFKVGANVSYSRRETNEPSSFTSGGASSNNAFMFIKWMAPVYPFYARNNDGSYLLDSDGNKQWDYGTGQSLSDYGQTTRVFSRGYHPQAYMDLDIFEQTRDVLSGRTYGELKFLKDFTLRGTLSVDNVYRTQTNFQNNEEGIAAGPPYNGYMTKYQNQLIQINTTQVLNYTKSFDRHTVIVDAGHEYMYENFRYMYAGKINIFVPGVPELNNAVTQNGSGSYTREEKLEGYFARVNYNYDDKYLFAASWRRDGTSRFKYDPWGNYLSVGVGWRISSENFMDGTKNWLDDLKIRANYGNSGNKNIYDPDGYAMYYPYTNTWSVGASGDGIGLTYYAQGHQDLTWETATTIDFGVDFVMFNGRLQGTLGYFNRQNKDLIWYRPTPPSTGMTSRIENVGKLENSGFEWEVTYNIIRNKDMLLNVNLIGSHIQQKLRDYPSEYGDTFVSGNYLRGKDKSYYNLYLYKYAGVNPANGEALFSGKSISTGEMTTVNYSNISTIEKTEIGDANPDITGGFNVNFKYKNFDVGVYTDFQVGGKIRFGDLVNISYDGRPGYAVSADAKNAWTPTNTNTDVPRAEMLGTIHTTASSDRFYFNASYFNLKTVNVGYTLPKSITDKLQMSSLRISFIMDNIWMKSAKKGLDPRRAFGGGDSYTFGFPQYKTWSVGLNVSF